MLTIFITICLFVPTFLPHFWSKKPPTKIKYLLFYAFVAEKTSYFCLVCKLFWPLWPLRIFTPWRWLIPSCPEDFRGQHKSSESAPNSLFLRIFWAGQMILLSSLPSSSITSLWGKPSNLWNFVSGRSILLHAFNPPRPKDPSWI